MTAYTNIVAMAVGIHRIIIAQTMLSCENRQGTIMRMKLVYLRMLSRSCLIAMLCWYHLRLLVNNVTFRGPKLPCTVYEGKTEQV